MELVAAAGPHIEGAGRREPVVALYNWKMICVMLASVLPSQTRPFPLSLVIY